MEVSKKIKRKGNTAKGADIAPPQPAEAPPSESSDEEIDEEEGGYRIGGVYIPPAPKAVCSSDNVGPRVIITHIVNENFKSYAGKQILGPFHKSFTSIIGPNGSGKSNVIDSMLFVFGYRASKIRSKKISVLLHKSENHQNVRSCTVAVHFVQINDQEGEEFEVIPNTEFVIARTAFHDNSSFYTVNGKRAQFKDVAALLRSHGIDLVHNRFLILQGEVEQIAMMKPKAMTEHETGMLEYLEDIIGTSRFKKPLEKLEVKLNLLNEERQEKINRVKLAEKDKEALREPMNEAVDYLKKKNELTRIKNQIEQLKLFHLETKLKGAKEEKEKLEAGMKGIKDRIKEAQETRLQKEEELNKKNKELEALNQHKEMISDQFHKIENRATQIKEDLSQTNKKRKKAIETKKQEEAKVDELEKLPEKNRKEIEELKKVEAKLLNEQAAEEEEVEKTLANIKKETEGLQETKDTINNKLIGLKTKKDEAKSNYEISKTELEMYLNNEKKEKASLDKLKAELEETSTTVKERQRALKEIEDNLPQSEQALIDSEKELVEVKGELNYKHQEISRQRAHLQEKRNAMQASKSRNKVLDFIMRQKENGTLPGVFGRLGDLGGIDAKYDCAISTACGPLDHIVTDNVNTAKQAVVLLKRHDIGRANFIALDQQEHLRGIFQKPLKTPENVPRLFDLIKVQDERVKPAFYFGLRDTLVADNLDQARRVAYGHTRYRVVSLEGEIIEIAGTMSGGGRDKRRGRMGRSATVVTDVASPGNLSKMDETLQRGELRLVDLNKRRAALEDTIHTLSRKIKQWKMNKQTFMIEFKELSHREPILKQKIKVQEEVVRNVAPDKEEVQKRTSVVNKLQKEFETASGACGELEKEVATITSKINALTGGKMKAARQKLDAVTKKLDKVKAEMTRLQVAIKTSERNKKKTLDHIQSLTTEIAEAEQYMLKIKEENERLIKEGSELNDKVEKACNEIIKLEVKVGDLRKAVVQMNEVENKLKAEKLVEDQKVDGINGKIKEIKSEIPHVQKSLNNLKLVEIPDQENNLELPKFTDEELTEFNENHLNYIFTRTNEALGGMKPNLETIEEFKKKEEIHTLRCAELDDVTKRRNEVRKGHDDVRKNRLNEFMAGFTVISSKLKEMYQMITLGGDAELDLSDSLDPFQEGVNFSVRPPKKSWKHISNLSGGEKTLSSLALVFALHYYKPSPLYVMDEIDAALDFKNVSIVGNYIKERTKNSQFIIISLRPNMFELADLLVGIYKTYNCTKSVTITPGKYCAPSQRSIQNDEDIPPSMSPPPAKILNLNGKFSH